VLEIGKSLSAKVIFLAFKKWLIFELSLETWLGLKEIKTFYLGKGRSRKRKA